MPPTFAEELRRQLNRHGLTVTALAERADTSREYLQTLLAGRRRPSLDLAARIFAHLPGATLAAFDQAPGARAEKNS